MSLLKPKGEKAPRVDTSQLKRMIEVVEQGGITHAEMRCIELEDQLHDAREETRRWRRCYTDLRGILACTGTNPDLERLDEIMRGWVGGEVVR